jgi:fluoride ion exporter CrcB/FEX
VKPSPKLLALVFAGGALGTLARYGVGLVTDMVVAVLIVKLVGAAFLGAVNGLGAKSGNHFSTDGSRAFWGAGFAGGFTTMSGLAGVFVIWNIWGFTLWSGIFIAGQFILGVLLYLGAQRVAAGKPAIKNSIEPAAPDGEEAK